MTFRGEMPVCLPSQTSRTFLPHESGVREAPPQ